MDFRKKDFRIVPLNGVPFSKPILPPQTYTRKTEVMCSFWLFLFFRNDAANLRVNFSDKKQFCQRIKKQIKKISHAKVSHLSGFSPFPFNASGRLPAST
jgi:hypothetical protein